MSSAIPRLAIQPDRTAGAQHAPLPSTVPKYALALNAQQQRACLAPLDRPLLVLAGAGSGKTSVMATRVRHILALDVTAPNILVVTFTKAADLAVRERLKSTLGAHAAKGVRVSTFHALALSICRSYAGQLDGYTNEFLVCTGAQQLKMVARALAELRVRRATAAAAAEEGDGPKPAAAPPLPTDAGRVLRTLLQAKAQNRAPESLSDECVRFVWGRYESWLRETNSLDMIDFVRVANSIL